ncbi:MAG: hypothetical protein D3908_15380, partial [Candidatus Electrothrix sp. AUS4]|nr:hypothetical protein [Candidatus Electrothrix sp. AUS4]
AWCGTLKTVGLVNEANVIVMEKVVAKADVEEEEISKNRWNVSLQEVFPSTSGTLKTVGLVNEANVIVMEKADAKVIVTAEDDSLFN